MKTAIGYCNDPLILVPFHTYSAVCLGASGTFWLYASVCLLGAVFTALWVPETRQAAIKQLNFRCRDVLSMFVLSN